MEVTAPKMIVSNRTLDFGSGFYTTSDLKQAERWAKLKTERQKKGHPVVSVYEFDKDKANKYLNIHNFGSANKEWLEYVASNRKNTYIGKKYDIVIGPVANDNTMPVISDYMAKNIDENTALILLKPQKLTDQYAFLTLKSLSCLSFTEVILL